MAKKNKLNTRLLLIILGVLIVGGGAAAVALYFQRVGDPTRNIRRGDEYMAEGKFDKAWMQFGRAMKKEPGNLVTLEKLELAISSIQPITEDEAIQRYNEWLAALRHASIHNPGNPQSHQRFLDNLYLAAKTIELEGFWKRLRQASDSMVMQVDEGTEGRELGFVYRGISDLRLNDAGLTATIDDDGQIRFPGEADLQAALAIDPNNDLALATLAFGRMAVARRLELEGRFVQGARNLEMAKASFATAIQRQPDGIEVNLALLRDFFIRLLVAQTERIRDINSVGEAEIQELSDQLNAVLDHVIEIYDVAANEIQFNEVIRFVTQIDRKNGRERIRPLLEAYLEIRPNDFEKRYQLAMLLRELGELDEARRHALLIIDAPRPTTGLDALKKFSLDKRSAEELFNIEYSTMQLAEDEDEKTAATARMMAARSVLSDYLSGEEGSAMALWADTRIAMASGRNNTAARLFNELLALDLPRQRKIEVLIGSIDTLNAVGMAGMALEHMGTLVELDPINPNYAILKAQAEAQLGLYSRAQVTLQVLPQDILDKYPQVKETLETIKLMATDSADAVTSPVLITLSEVSDLIMAGNVDGGLQLLLETNAKYPDDIRLMIALSQTQMQAGNTSEAERWINEAISRSPNNKRLEEMQASIMTNNPVEAILMIAETRFPDPKQRAVLTLINLSLLQGRIESDMVFHKGRGNLVDLAEAEALLVKIQAALVTSREHAAAVAPDHPARQAFELERALEIGDIAAAESLLADAVRLDIDQAGGALVTARMRLASGVLAKEAGDTVKAAAELDQAVEAAIVACQRLPYASVVWRIRGDIHLERGEGSDAMEAYAEAYRRDPSDQDTIRAYSMQLLGQGDEPLRALRILQIGAEQFPTNLSIRNAWLQVEALYGDPIKAMLFRESLVATEPNNRTNRLRLAALLAEQTPSREMLLDEHGQERVTVRHWQRLTSSQRQLALDGLQEIWDQEIAEHLTLIESAPNRSLQHAIAHAGIFSAQDDLPSARTVLKSFLSGRTSEPTYGIEVIAAAQFFLDQGFANDGVMLMKSEVPSQSPQREIDAALGNLLFQLNEHSSAITHLQSAFEVNPDAVLHARLVESLVSMQRFDEASALLNADVEMTNPQFTQAMLRAIIEEGRARHMAASGNTTGARAAIEAHREALTTANQLDPANVGPYMKLSKSLLQEHMATRQQEVLAEAITIVNQGLEVMPDSNELAIRSADTLQAAGRLREAIDQLDTVLRRRPASTAVRQRLISAYLDTHDHDKAIDTAKQGITVSPDRGMWYESLGDLHRATSDDLVAASAAYLQAFDRNRSQSLLVKLAVATRTTSPWDYQAAHDLLIASPGLVASQPLAQGLLARAEAGLGLDNRAQDHLRNAYHAHVKTIEAGGAGPRSMEFWYDDLFVIFGEDDAQKGDDLAQELIGSTPTLWDLTGRGKYWASIEGGKGKAIEILQTAVGRGRTEDSTRVPLFLSILGNYQLRNGDLEAAAASFKESSDLRPSDPMAMNNYAYVLGVNLNRPAEAEEFSIRAVQMSPRNANLLDTLATIQAMKGDYSRALATRLQQLVATPGDSDLLVKIAFLHANDLQQPAKALPFIDQAMAIRPGDASATSDAGWYYTQAGKVVEGEEFLRKAERADPSARTLIRLATVMLNDDRLSQARRRLESAMETDPDEATRAEILALLDDIRSRESP